MLDCDNSLNETIQFRNVKHFELLLSRDVIEYSNLWQKVPALGFGKLETFVLDALTQDDSTAELIDVACECIAKNQMLHSVELLTPEWSFQQMQRLLQTFTPTMKTLKVTWYPKQTVDGFRQFLEQTMDIEKISVTLWIRPYGATSWRMEDLGGSLPAQWIMGEKFSDRYEESFVLTRKHWSESLFLEMRNIPVYIPNWYMPIAYQYNSSRVQTIWQWKWVLLNFIPWFKHTCQSIFFPQNRLKYNKSSRLQIQCKNSFIVDICT